MSNERSGFSSRLGFVLATAGSAVGLGNIWRFPYLAAKYGGGTFLLTYLILTLTFGFSLMITEVALGRKAGTSAIRAFGHFSKKHTFIGYLTTIIPFIIFPYYCVIGGWVTKYALISLQGGIHNAASDTFFTGFISKSAEPMICFPDRYNSGCCRRSQRRSRTCQHDHDASFDRLVDRSFFILYHKTRGDGWSCILFKTKFKRIWSDNDLSCTWTVILFDVPCYGYYDHIRIIYAKES